jgi:hypothetical protein
MKRRSWDRGIQKERLRIRHHRYCYAPDNFGGAASDNAQTFGSEARSLAEHKRHKTPRESARSTMQVAWSGISIHEEIHGLSTSKSKVR